MRVKKQPSYILHRRPFKNSSLIIDCMTIEYGRVSLVAHAGRKQKSAFYSFLHPCHELAISWVGRGDLKTLQQVDPISVAERLTADALLFAAYAHEILLRLLQPGLAFPALYLDYQKLLVYLGKEKTFFQQWRVMCYFIVRLLKHLGYELPLDRTHVGELITDSCDYYFKPCTGFIAVDQQGTQQHKFLQKDITHVFPGKILVLLKDRQLASTEDIVYARRLLSLALQHQLGDKPLQSASLLDVIINEL